MYMRWFTEDQSRRVTCSTFAHECHYHCQHVCLSHQWSEAGKWKRRESRAMLKIHRKIHLWQSPTPVDRLQVSSVVRDSWRRTDKEIQTWSVLTAGGYVLTNNHSRWKRRFRHDSSFPGHPWPWQTRCSCIRVASHDEQRHRQRCDAKFHMPRRYPFYFRRSVRWWRRVYCL